ncbi:MAG: hypothetical protein HOE53_00495 [Candidatus Magasanikbacteria bacterium]|nr:hypothetical protein [Candidatus Magasanikbacteria bacterium]
MLLSKKLPFIIAALVYPLVYYVMFSTCEEPCLVTEGVVYGLFFIAPVAVVTFFLVYGLQYLAKVRKKIVPFDKSSVYMTGAFLVVVVLGVSALITTSYLARSVEQINSYEEAQELYDTWYLIEYPAIASDILRSEHVTLEMLEKYAERHPAKKSSSAWHGIVANDNASTELLWKYFNSGGGRFGTELASHVHSDEALLMALYEQIAEDQYANYVVGAIVENTKSSLALLEKIESEYAFEMYRKRATSQIEKRGLR